MVWQTKNQTSHQMKSKASFHIHSTSRKHVETFAAPHESARSTSAHSSVGATLKASSPSRFKPLPYSRTSSALQTTPIVSHIPPLCLYFSPSTKIKVHPAPAGALLLFPLVISHLISSLIVSPLSSPSPTATHCTMLSPCQSSWLREEAAPRRTCICRQLRVLWLIE